ncbi:MAG: glycosyltransferase family 2 protein [Planctomycetes bacterium]|nr:glycosyltransferase family 2 protein [Planctomycetota bacterium]
MPPPTLSVVVPAYNEAGVIGHTLKRVHSVLEPRGDTWEVVVVDDGSIDATAAEVEAFLADHPQVRLVQFSRNFGHQCAVTAGLCEARGNYVAVLDADLQDPPELLCEMLDKAEEGYDVVYGVRGTRKGGLLKRFAYWLYYRLFELASEHQVPLDAGDFSLMSRRAVNAINALPERNRYVRGLRSWVGFRQIGVPYERPDREHGQPKYGWIQLVRLALSGLLSFSRVPLKASSWLGVVTAGLGFAWALKVTYMKLRYGTSPAGFSAVMVAVLSLGGCNLIAIGVMGHYLGRVLDQVEGRPHYVIARRVEAEPAVSEDSE